MRIRAGGVWVVDDDRGADIDRRRGRFCRYSANDGRGCAGRFEPLHGRVCPCGHGRHRLE
jgi:hypothetical protein